MNASGTNTGGYTATNLYTSRPAANESGAGYDSGNRNYYTASNAYKTQGTYYDKNVRQEDLDKLNSLSYMYSQAKARGDTALAEDSHSQAEAIRAAYGYSGGSDGTMGTAIETTGPKMGSGYQAAALPAASNQEAYINDIYKAQRQAALQALRSAYDQNVISLDAAARELPQTYQNARNTQAAASEQEKANWNQYMSASGLNAGSGAQGRLSMSNQLMGNMSSINAQEAKAVNDLNTQRLQLQTQYQNDISQAIANGDLQKAQVLYQEAVRVDESLVSTAQAQANENYRAWGANTSVTSAHNDRLLQYAQTLATYGDYSGYKALGYTDAQIAAMQDYWMQLNGVDMGEGSTSSNQLIL